MIVSKYFNIDGKMYVEASDYDELLYKLKYSNDKIAELEYKINNLRARCHKSAIDNFENGNYAGLFIVKADRLKNDNKVKELQCELDKTYNQLMEVEKEAQEHIAELESELEVKDNLLKIKNGLCEDNETAKINLNDTIKVKLTPLGAEIYYKQFDELNKQYGREICKPLMPRIDKDGYTEFQLWHFIELYGQHIGLGKTNVIEPLDIVYCGNDKRHSDNA